MTRRATGDTGSTSVSVALLTPVFVVLLFAAVQAALWGHARTEARVAAKTVAAQIARQGVAGDDAANAAAANLADGRLTGVTVSVSVESGIVKVTVSGEAPGVLIGTSRRVAVTEAVPLEELSPK